MSKKIMYLLLAVSLGLNAGVIATTLIHRGPPPPMDGPPRGPGGPGGENRGPAPDSARLVDGHVRGMTQHLDLDAQQQETVRAVLEQNAPDLARFQLEAAEAARRLSDAFAAPVFDAERFKQLTAETAAARSRLDSMSAVLLMAEAAILTPEQRRKFAEVAPTIHTTPQRPRREGGPPPRNAP